MSLADELARAVVVDLPLRGEWRAQQTPGSRIPSHGTDLLAQRYAYDLLRADGRRGLNLHPGGSLRTWAIGVPTTAVYGWGQPVHSALDGQVVVAADGIPERSWIHPIREIAGALWTGLTYNPARQGFGPVAGNHVITRHGELYAAYAHLVPGSIPVKAGDTVRTGDAIGRVGHSGNSTAPHLHFQLMDGPDPVSANAIPAAFRALEVLRDDAWIRETEVIPTSSDRFRWVA